MKKYYILRADGSSIFEEAYREDFIFHCLINLLDRSDELYSLCWFDDGCKFASVQLDRGKGDRSPLLAFMEFEYM